MFFLKSDTNSASPSETIESYTMSSRNTAAPVSAATKPYCKVCYDAGRPEKEYTSHYVKDQPGPQGKVICPTLLNQHCRICDKTGHTSSYCPQYRSRREEPRREERYIEREQPRREERYIEREPRREERYIEREQPRREERYIEREQPRREERYIEREQPRREERNTYDRLREDTERREREIRDRDDAHYREQDRRAKPWLQAALKPATESHQQQRREPYAHPHGPRVRLNLEATALCASKHAVVDNIEQEAAPAAPAIPAFDVRKMQLNLASNWSDEDPTQPFVCDPEKMAVDFLKECIMSDIITSQEYDFIAECDDQSGMPFNCGQ
jgi:hypothetical protein